MDDRIRTILSRHPKRKQKEILERVFDKLYKRAVKLASTNYCGVKCGNCIAGRLEIEEYQKDKSFGKPKKFAGCCSGCKHLGPKGCTVEALTCRAHFCGCTRLLVSMQNRLDHLNNSIWRWGLCNPRGNKKESISRAMTWLV